MKKIRLYCLPYGGGSAMVYNRWKNFLKDKIEVVPIELAGRGKRIKEPFYKSFEEAVDDVYNRLKNEFNNFPYAILGHSMGSILAHEIMRKIQFNKHQKPMHLFFSGRYPPHITKRKLSNLPDKYFKDEILKIGGTPNEVFEHEELEEIFLPILRSDYKMLEQYKYIPIEEGLGCDITILFGDADRETNINELYEWSNYTKKDFNIYGFNGGHFFIFQNENEQKIFNIIKKALNIPCTY